LDFRKKEARFVRLQLRETQYFHLDEVEIYGTQCKSCDATGTDEAALAANFYRHQTQRPPVTLREVSSEMLPAFTVDDKIPVLHWYINNTVSSPTHLGMVAYDNAIDQLNRGDFKYYGETLHHLSRALNQYPVLNKSVLVFGLTGVNCDAISLWKGAKLVYVIDYNLPISEHPQVQVISYEHYTKSNIQADTGISISSFEHDGLGRYGDPINPTGDFEAMKLAKKLIKKGGFLFLAVPVGKDCIVWNAHRIYGRIRLPMMLEGWELIECFGFDDSLFDQRLGAYRKQPVFVLKNL